MLTHIHISNFAIVDKLELELDSGMTALTGETGAGKSILIGALGLALGDRADSGVIRHGSDRAEINAGFDLTDAPDAVKWLEDQDMNNDQECYIRRVITKEGRSRAYINGSPAPLQSLKQLGELLIDIHGQHEHQSLLKKDIQRTLLDDYAGNTKHLEDLSRIVRQWKSTNAELEALRSASADRIARSDLLKYQLHELTSLDLHDNEIEQMDEEHKRLANAGHLVDTCSKAIDQLYDNENQTVHQSLSHISTELESLSEIDPALSSANKLINDALILTQEATDELRHYTDRLELDPQRLQWIDERLGSIHDLARKHRVLPKELPALLLQLQSEFDNLEHADDRIISMQEEIDALIKEYENIAKEVSKKRKQAAKRLNKEVSNIIQNLGMPGASFEIQLEKRDSSLPNATGIESVEFSVSSNLGQPVKPISKIASGGELSRISLAIQVILASNTRIPTLIYDEVDTGIGGPTAEVVGMQLHNLGSNRQVMCVTHLPQVASQANHHLYVSKVTEKNQTRTQIKALNEDERTNEIARMLGGIEMTEQSHAHAKEMIQRSHANTQPKSKRKRAEA